MESTFRKSLLIYEEGSIKFTDTLYSMLAQKLRGFEQCDAQKIYRNFVRGKADVKITGGEMQVTYPRKAHNPILRGVPWQRLPQTISWLGGAKLKLKFQ